MHRYGAAVLAGIYVAERLERGLRSVPIVGSLLAPLFFLVPTSLVGAALGAAVVYSYEEGDPKEVARRHWPKVWQLGVVTHGPF